MTMTIARAFFAVLALLTAAWPALAQNQGNGVQQSGPVTPGHASAWRANGVIGDAGASSAPTQANQGGIFGGLNVLGGACVEDGYNNLTLSPGGYHQLCLFPDALGGGLISYNAYNGAAQLGLNLNINGSTFPFPGAGNGNIVGPTSPAPTAKDFVLWNGGLTVQDSANVAALHSWTFPGSVGALTNAMEINVGSFPTASEIPAAVLQGLSVKVAVPSSFTEQPWPATAVSGYITNGNTSSANSTVAALFGFAGQTTGTGSPGTPFGFNVIAANCATVGCANGSGFANGNAIGGEIDVNVKKIGASTPIGQIVGMFITGDTEAMPSNGAYALRVKQLGTSLPWSVGFQTDNGAASSGLILGAGAQSGASDSQPAIWSANDGSPIFMSAILDQTQFLEFLGSPDLGGIIARTVQSRESFTVGPLGSGVNVLSSLSGSNTSVYGDLGTVALVLQNTVPQNAYRNTAHIFQNIAGNVNFATVNASGLNLGSGEVFSIAAANGVTCSGSPTSSFASVGGIVTHC